MCGVQDRTAFMRFQDSPLQMVCLMSIYKNVISLSYKFRILVCSWVSCVFTARILLSWVEINYLLLESWNWLLWIESGLIGYSLAMPKWERQTVGLPALHSWGAVEGAMGCLFRLCSRTDISLSAELVRAMRTPEKVAHCMFVFDPQ